MHIGIDATALYGLYGGVEYALWNLLVALSAQEKGEARFTVYIPADGPPPELLQTFGGQWNFVRLSFVGAAKARRILWQQTQLAAQLKRDGCDLLHAPTYVAPWRAGVPFVLTVYDLIALLQPQFATPPNRVHYRALLPRSLAQATRVIVPSNRVRDDVVALENNYASKIRVVAPGLEPIFFEQPTTEQFQKVRTRYSLPDRYLLFAGNFEPKKNLSNLLAAHAILRAKGAAPPLVVAGGGRAWRGQEVLPGSGVIPIGYVARRDLPALYAGAAALAFPSLAEGFGMPVLEALACGTPVVASPAVALPDIEKYALLCDPQSPESIANALQQALENKSESTRRASAMEYSHAFTWRASAQSTLSIYREALARQR